MKGSESPHKRLLCHILGLGRIAEHQVGVAKHSLLVEVDDHLPGRALAAPGPQDDFRFFQLCPGRDRCRRHYTDDRSAVPISSTQQGSTEKYATYAWEGKPIVAIWHSPRMRLSFLDQRSM